MGPPSMNGGRVASKPLSDGGELCFNGAAVDERRKGRTALDRPRPHRSFNGAAVDERRKAGLSTVAGGCPCSFNGAAVDERRKGGACSTTCGRRGGASMGPPSMNGGRRDAFD